MASMISFQDHLRSLVMLRCDAHLKYVLPRMVEKAGRPWLLRRFKVLQCEGSSGAQIKWRHRHGARMPSRIQALQDTERCVSVMIVFKNVGCRCGWICVKGVFDEGGAPIVMSRGVVHTPAALKALHYRHLFPDTRRSSREELMVDLAEHLRAVVAARQSSLLQRGIADDSIDLTRTRALLSGLESGVKSEDLLLRMDEFIAPMQYRENYVLDLEDAGKLPRGTDAEISELLWKLRFVLS